MTINPIEATWLLINLVSAAVTVSNLVDAWHGWRALRGMGRAREVLARANLRREAVRLLVAIGLIVVILPALFRPGDTVLSPYLMVIMAVPALLALNSYLDRRTRRTLSRLVRGKRSVPLA